MLLAQAPVGTIAGMVTDDSGAVIVAAKVTVTNRATGLSRALLTGPEGRYSAPSLPAGDYDVQAQAAGFLVSAYRATVATGATTAVDIRIKPGATGEVVTVEGAAPQISFDSHQVGSVVQRAQVEDLPLNGRNFIELSKLEPGVTVPSTRPSAGRQLVPVMGAPSPLEGQKTRVTVDGGDLMNFAAGGTAMNLSQEVVQEFQISTVNFDLSTGVTAAGAVNIVTRSGGNDFHGSGYYFYRDHKLSAYPALNRDPANPDPFFQRRQAGASVGGPIRKDRLFFFANFEDSDQRSVFTVQPKTPEFAKFGSISPAPSREREISTRFDIRLNANQNAFLRYSHDGNTLFGPGGNVSTASPPSNWIYSPNWTDQSLGALTSVLRSNLVNDLRFSYLFTSFLEYFPSAAQCPGQCIGLGMPQITIAPNLFTIGNAYARGGRNYFRVYDTNEGLTWERGAHRIRFGVEWEHDRASGSQAAQNPAAMSLYSPDSVRKFDAQAPPERRIPLPASFDTIQDILRLPLLNFSFAIGDSHSIWPGFATVFAQDLRRFYWQDTWRVRPRFTLNYGLAYFYETGRVNHDLSKPEYLRPLLGAEGLAPTRNDPNNFSPSLGLAWGVTSDNRTVVRAGAGLYYDPPYIASPRPLERVLLSPRGRGRITLQGSGIGNPISGIPGVPAGQPLNFPAAPTAFTGADLLSILPMLSADLQRKIGDPNNTDFSVRNIEVLKQGSQLFTHRFTTGYGEHVNIGVQRELARGLVLTGDFVYRQFIHDRMGDIDFNRYLSARGPVIPKCTGSQIDDPKAVCSTGPITFFTSDSRAKYKGLLVRLDKRFSRRTQFLVSYAFSSDTGFNGVGPGFDNDNWFGNYGPLALDRWHVLNVSGLIDLTKGLQVSFVSTYYSPAPFTAYVGNVDLNGDGTVNDALPGAGVNQFGRSLGKSDLARLVDAFSEQYANKKSAGGQMVPRLTLPANFDFGKSYITQDLRLSKQFRFGEHYKLTLLGEVFNALNIANLTGYNGNLAATPTFGQPTDRVFQVFGSGGPRAFQLGARVGF